MKNCLVTIMKKYSTNQRQQAWLGCFPPRPPSNNLQRTKTHTLSSVCGVVFIVNLLTSRIIEKTCTSTGLQSFNFFRVFICTCNHNNSVLFYPESNEKKIFFSLCNASHQQPHLSLLFRQW